ncbi:uncharacterized protein DFL_008435 [Arthrobotrys flagrans]|uniref:Uncharacterized protein n=1 Tax=Arthrobotrys flagrans TaxID=97331 RepID=A0A436ZNS7_ARTFL|nr:hypothetical protein DFL_008435 [Arthrobotrys flagrans]
MGSDPTPRNSFYSPPKHVPGFSADFNPKAVQEAAQNPPPKKRPISGQYIESVPAGRYHVPAGMSMEKHLRRQANIQMAKRTIIALKASRWIMLVARLLQLVAAIGLVVLLITLRGMDTINGWIMRIPPGVAILHIVYSIYHNARDPKERAPLSSAGYALFAVGSDCCIIPFYVFIGLWTWQQRAQMIANPDNPDNWVSVFNKDNSEFSQLMVFISFITACAGGGLMVITVMLGLFIAITFRRISRLPPDMNPLDDTTYTSLTARPSSKRFSKSSISSGESFEKSASRDVSPKRAVPFLEIRTKNGSLNWEFTKDSDSYTKSALDLSGAPNITSNAPLLPPPHKFGEYGDTRRRSQDQSKSAPNSPGHRKNKSMGYYSDHDNNGPSTPPRPPRQTYKQRPAEWWTASNLQSNFGNAFPSFNNSGQNSRYSAVSQSDNDAHSTSTFGSDPHVSRNTFGRAPSHTTGQPDQPPQISSYAGSISTATAPSVVSSMPQSNPNRNSFGLNPHHMSTPPGVVPTLGSLGTLGTFATDLTPRPLSFPTNSFAPGSPTKNSPNHQHRNSVGRIPYARPNAGGSPGHSPTKSVNGVLGSYARPPPQTSLTPPQMSPTKTGVSGTRMADNFGPSSYTKGGNAQNNGLMTPINSTPSSPTKGTPPNSTAASKKKKYDTLSQNSPGRSTSWEKKQQQIQAQLARSQQGGYSSGEDRPRIKKMDKGRRKSLRELRDEREKEREREKEGKTRVVSNSGADFGHMFGNGNGVRGRVISGSQVV